MKQKKLSFDQITQNKIIRGAMIASTGAAALALFDYVGTIEIDNPLIASILVWAIPFGVNLVKEWMAGE